MLSQIIISLHTWSKKRLFVDNFCHQLGKMIANLSLNQLVLYLLVKMYSYMYTIIHGWYKHRVTMVIWREDALSNASTLTLEIFSFSHEFQSGYA